MYLPRIDDERDTLCNYLDVQLDSIRASAFGLEEDQVRETPLRSALSVGGIIKHVVFVMEQSLSGAGIDGYEQPSGTFSGSFALTADESFSDVLASFDATRADYMTMCRGGDLEVEIPVGPMPWFGLNEPRVAKLRYLYVHHVEEFARHAGHADIIREQIDGAKSAELLAAVEGWPANSHVTPWSAE